MAKHKKRVLERKTRSQKSEKQKQLLVTYFIVVLMVASIVGFAMSGSQTNEQNSLTYNSYTLLYTLEPHPLVSGYSINSFVEKKSGALFYTSPFEAEAIPTQGNLSAMIQQAPYLVYLFEPDTDFDSLHDWVRFELSSRTNKIIIPALTQESDVYTELPVASCLNATTDMPIIFVEQAAQTNITISPTGCIHIKTKPQDIVFIRDRLLYTLSGIIKT